MFFLLISNLILDISVMILVLALDSIFLVLKHLIFGLDVADLILEGDEFVFFVFELIELFFE